MLKFKIDETHATTEASTVRFLVTIDRDEDGAWVVECPSIPGCVSQGATREKALENIRDAIRGCLEVRAEKGMPLTVETLQVEVTARNEKLREQTMQ